MGLLGLDPERRERAQPIAVALAAGADAVDPGVRDTDQLARTKRRRGRTGRVCGVLVIVAPGQGAQTPGFLTPWLEDPTFKSRIHWLSTVAGLDLIHYGTEADADTIRDTKIAQPLLVATGLVAGHAFLAGAPQMTFYLALLLGAYALFNLSTTNRWRY